MIETSTTMVFGAGSNLGYGFLLGDQLKNDVHAELVNGKEPARSDLFPIFANECGWNASKFASLCYDIWRALPGCGSVDDYLEKFGDDKDKAYLVKTAIFKTIILREANSTLIFERNLKDKFYDLIWSLVSEGLKTQDVSTIWEQQRIKFITFNYDRSLEYFFYSRIRQTFNPPKVALEKAMADFPIVHIYGSLGSLFGERSLAYGINWETALQSLGINYIVNSIITYSERAETEFTRGKK